MSDEVRAVDITFPGDGVELAGYGARPAGNGPFPGLILIHDVWGLHEHFRDLARRYAAEGFFTLAVDLYTREGDPELADVAAAMRWIRELPDRRVLADLAAAHSYLEDHPLVAGGAVGVTGYCMGGQYALMAACEIAGLAACVSWYGMLRYESTDEANPESPLHMAPRLRCPLLGLFGADDPIIPVRDVEELGATLEREGKDFEIEIYQGAGHAFANDTRPDMYRPEVAARAWPRAVDFLHAHLDGER